MNNCIIPDIIAIPEPPLTEATIRDAEEKFRLALENYYQAVAECQDKGMDYIKRRLCQLEDVVLTCLQMNIQREAVDSLRLRLKLLGAKNGSVAAITFSV
jgi:hypothetical protein